MTPHDDVDPETDRVMDELLDAASDEAESDSEAVWRPAFAAVLARAQQLNPRLAAPQARRAAQPTRSDDDETLAAALAPFVEAAQLEAELDVAAQADRGAPGLPRRGRASPVRWALIAGPLALAAAVVLLFGLLEARDARRADEPPQDNQALDQAERMRPMLEAETRGSEHEPPSTMPRARPASPRPEPAAVIPEQEAPLERIEPVPASAPEEPETEIDVSPAQRRSRRQRALLRLDDQAQRRLDEGDAAGAERAYRALVRKGGSSGLAQLAYGDLFTLAHRRGDAKGQRELWREYLRKFPRGRFADDARAGLCRLADASERATCWERYLDQFPTGAYHRQAGRALSRDQGPTVGEPDQ